MQDPREKIQQESKQAFLNSTKQVSLILPTGSGKSKVAIDLIKELEPDKILLLSNSQDLRDSNWKQEFDKWWPGSWSTIQSECYQTAYKETWRLGKKYDMIIFDKLCRIKTYLIDWKPLRALHTPQSSDDFVIVTEVKIGQSAAKTPERRSKVQRLSRKRVQLNP